MYDINPIAIKYLYNKKIELLIENKTPIQIVFNRNKIC